MGELDVGSLRRELATFDKIKSDRGARSAIGRGDTARRSSDPRSENHDVPQLSPDFQLVPEENVAEVASIYRFMSFTSRQFTMLGSGERRRLIRVHVRLL